jgi:hypothetical protein
MVQRGVRGFERKSCFTATAWTGQGDQSASTYEILDNLNLLLAADEAGQPQWNVVSYDG